MTCIHCDEEVREVPSLGYVHDASGAGLCALDVLEDENGDPIPRTRAEV